MTRSKMYKVHKNQRGTTYFECVRCGKQKARIRKNMKIMICATCTRRLREGGFSTTTLSNRGGDPSQSTRGKQP